MNTTLILAAADAAEESTLASAIIGFLPLVLFLLVLWLFLRKHNSRTKGYMDRALEHMDAMEKKTDRMIELIEEIRKK